jgi:hypothetical protein
MPMKSVFYFITMLCTIRIGTLFCPLRRRSINYNKSENLYAADLLGSAIAAYLCSVLLWYKVVILFIYLCAAQSIRREKCLQTRHELLNAMCAALRGPLGS